MHRSPPDARPQQTSGLTAHLADTATAIPAAIFAEIKYSHKFTPTVAKKMPNFLRGKNGVLHSFCVIYVVHFSSFFLISYPIYSFCSGLVGNQSDAAARLDISLRHQRQASDRNAQARSPDRLECGTTRKVLKAAQSGFHEFSSASCIRDRA